MNELKPCPFCGSEIEFIPSHVEEQNFVNSASIICRKCRNEYVGATFIVPGEIESEELTNNILINWWNTRPAEDALKAEVERLKDVIKEIREISDNVLDIGIEFIGAGLDGMTGGVEEWEDMKRGRRKIRKLAKEALKKNVYAPDINVGTKESEVKDD